MIEHGTQLLDVAVELHQREERVEHRTERPSVLPEYCRLHQLEQAQHLREQLQVAAVAEDIPAILGATAQTA